VQGYPSRSSQEFKNGLVLGSENLSVRLSE